MNDQPSGRAIASLVFGILGLTACPCAGGLLAILLGAGERHPVGRAGMILGWISVGLTALAGLLGLLVLVLGGGLRAFG
ncbi:MAG: hypothetical protein AB1726_13205 [Planctomycetota bacterium]